MKQKLPILLLLLLLQAPHQGVLCVPPPPPQPVHFLVRWKAWHILSALGCVGTLLNTLLFYTFYNCDCMATSVNAMIFMETLYSMVYTTIGIHWRTCNMVSHNSCLFHWFSKEEVKC